MGLHSNGMLLGKKVYNRELLALVCMLCIYYACSSTAASCFISLLFHS